MAYKLIQGGGVTTPKGFLAGACYVGVKSRKSEKPDVAMIYSEYPASCAAMFTTNKFCAAPVILDREILKKGKARRRCHQQRQRQRRHRRAGHQECQAGGDRG